MPSYAVSDHYPVCFTRRTSSKVFKNHHTTTTYRCFKHFNESDFIADLSLELLNFETDNGDVNTDVHTWLSTFLRNINKHAPLRTKRVKHINSPAWMTSDILECQQSRDYFKSIKDWENYRFFRNKTKAMILSAKTEHFSDSISSNKDTRTIWKHLRSVVKPDSKNSSIPDKLAVSDKTYTDPVDIVKQLNEYFATLPRIINDSSSNSRREHPNLDSLKTFVTQSVPDNIFFKIPFINEWEVSEFLQQLNPAKATGLDGIGPRILKIASLTVTPSITKLINKSIATGIFPNQLKLAKVFPIFKGGTNKNPSNYRHINITYSI